MYRYLNLYDRPVELFFYSIRNTTFTTAGCIGELTLYKGEDGYYASSYYPHWYDFKTFKAENLI